MTIKEHLISLREDYIIKSENYLKTEKQLSGEANGFFDKKLLDDLSEASTAWRKASDAYHNFLSHIATNKLNIDALMDK